MISLKELKTALAEDYNDMIFVYKGKHSGVTSEVHDSVPTFYIWFGDKEMSYSKYDDMLHDKFFDGKSLAELSKIVQFEFA